MEGSFEERTIFQMQKELLSGSAASGAVQLAFGIVAFALVPAAGAFVAVLFLMALLYALTVSRALAHNIAMSQRLFALRDHAAVSLMFERRPANAEEIAAISREVDEAFLTISESPFDWQGKIAGFVSYLAIQGAVVFVSIYLGLLWSADIRRSFDAIYSYIQTMAS